MRFDYIAHMGTRETFSSTWDLGCGFSIEYEREVIKLVLLVYNGCTRYYVQCDSVNYIIYQSIIILIISRYNMRRVQ